MQWTGRQQKILIYIQVQMKNVPGNSYIKDIKIFLKVIDT